MTWYSQMSLVRQLQAWTWAWIIRARDPTIIITMSYILKSNYRHRLNKQFKWLKIIKQTFSQWVTSFRNKIKDTTKKNYNINNLWKVTQTIFLTPYSILWNPIWLLPHHRKSWLKVNFIVRDDNLEQFMFDNQN